jgi:hypothetical protein
VISTEKNLTQSVKNWEIAKLSLADIEAISSYEQTAWPQAIQASYQTLKSRLELNHFMLGIWRDDQLVGLASWRRAWFDPTSKLAFPTTFNEFSNTANATPYNAAFAYNLSIRPDMRGTEMTRALVQAVIEHAKLDNCQYLVGDGRCPSYNGSDSSTEHITQSSKFKIAIDHQLQSDERPTLEEYLADPILCFYHRMLNCTFLWTMQNFIPSDISSGGHRVIFYKSLI